MRCSLCCEIEAELWGSRGCAGRAYDCFYLFDEVTWPVEWRLRNDVPVSLSGGFVEIQGKFWHSPSNCASCCVVDANVDSRCACCFVEIQGKFWHSPSKHANCCVVVANVASQRACSFCFCNSRWGTLMIHEFGTLGIVRIVWFSAEAWPGGCVARWTMVVEWCHGHLSLVALLKYKEVSFDTHQVIVLIVV